MIERERPVARGTLRFLQVGHSPGDRARRSRHRSARSPRETRAGPEQEIRSPTTAAAMLRAIMTSPPHPVVAVRVPRNRRPGPPPGRPRAGRRRPATRKIPAPASARSSGRRRSGVRPRALPPTPPANPTAGASRSSPCLRTNPRASAQPQGRQQHRRRPQRAAGPRQCPAARRAPETRPACGAERPQAPGDQPQPDRLPRDQFPEPQPDLAVRQRRERREIASTAAGRSSRTSTRRVPPLLSSTSDGTRRARRTSRGCGPRAAGRSGRPSRSARARTRRRP